VNGPANPKGLRNDGELEHRSMRGRQTTDATNNRPLKVPSVLSLGRDQA